MLVFKKNIYDPAAWSGTCSGGTEPLDPYDFLLTTLTTDRKVFISLERMDTEEGNEKCRILFPHASRFGTIPVLNNISKRLLEGLVNPQTWFRMSAYHLCYLYDSLNGMVEEYSYEDPAYRNEMFPAIHGRPINLEEFLDNFFFDTAFLVDPDRFNALTAEEKKERGWVDPCLFGVINKLIPSEQEINLQKVEHNPFSGMERKK